MREAGENYLKNYSKKIFPNNQKLDFNNILGRLLSSSYMIQTSHKKYPTLKNDLELIFNKHNVNGYINFEYNTEVYTGKL